MSTLFSLLPDRDMSCDVMQKPGDSTVILEASVLCRGSEAPAPSVSNHNFDFSNRNFLNIVIFDLKMFKSLQPSGP